MEPEGSLPHSQVPATRGYWGTPVFLIFKCGYGRFYLTTATLFGWGKWNRIFLIFKCGCERFYLTAATLFGWEKCDRIFISPTTYAGI
jgi:hypothetical protein